MLKIRKKYTSGPRYWNVPVLVNTGTFYVYQYCLEMWYLRYLECAGGIQKQTILECQNGLVLSNTRVPVSGTWSILFPKIPFILTYSWRIMWYKVELWYITSLWTSNRRCCNLEMPSTAGWNLDFFLPALYQRNQQTCNTPAKLNAILFVQHTLAVIRAFHTA